MSEIVRFETLKGAGGKGRGPRDQVAVFTTGRPWLVYGVPRLYFRVGDARWQEVDSIVDARRGAIEVSLAGDVEAIQRRLKYAAELAGDHLKSDRRVFAILHVLRFRLSKHFRYICPFCARLYVRSGDYGRHVDRAHHAFALEWEGVRGAVPTGWHDRLIEPAVEVPTPQFEAYTDDDTDDDINDADWWKRAA